jgi:hypothetical protein
MEQAKEAPIGQVGRKKQGEQGYLRECCGIKP